MSLQLGFTKKLELRTEKVKCVDIHPVEPWVASALYNGSCTIYNYSTQSLIKRIDICDVPLRTCKFVARKQWILAAGDKMCIWVYNYNSLEKVNIVEGHKDYIRSLDVHSTLPHVISCSDDMTIILWNIDKNWEKVATYEGHSHYVMMAKWNPKDVNIFASCSLDRTIMFWGLHESSSETPKPFFTLTGHERGINCIDFSTNPSCPYIVSGSDDCTIRVWDYQTKLCFQVLKQHIKGVTNVLYHPRLPIILSCGEDGDFNVWNANLYKIKRSVNYGYGKIWSISSNSIDTAIGSDSGTCVIQLAGEKPLVSMHTNKLVMVKSSDIMSCNLSTVDQNSITAGQPLNLAFRNIGSCEFFPQHVSYHPNGRFICLYGDSEFIIYTSQGMKSKCYGKASQLVWSTEGGYATYNGVDVTIYHDFAVRDVIRPEEPVVRLFGGHLLGISSMNSISFYDWASSTLVRFIENIQVDNVWWNEACTRLSISTPSSCFILKYQAVVEDENDKLSFQLEKEIVDRVTSGSWALETFIYINGALHLNLYISGVTETLVYLDRPLHMIGYSNDSALIYLCDDKITCYPLETDYLTLHSLLDSRTNDELLLQILDKLPEKLKERASKLLESLQEYKLSLYCTNDQDRKFELNIKLGNIAQCLELLNNEPEQKSHNNLTTRKWKRLGEHALKHSAFDVAIKCFKQSKDHSNLLLLYTVTGNKDGIRDLAEDSLKEGSVNISFTCYYMLNDVQKCISILHMLGRHGEAAIMARTFKPSLVDKSLDTWRSNFKNNNKKLLELTIEEDSLELEKLLEERLNLSFPSSTEYKSYKDAIHVDFKNLADKSELAVSWKAGL